MGKKKTQVSFEFVLIFMIVLGILTVFLALIYAKISEVDNEKDYLMMETLANNIKNEVVLASQVNNNYLRRFTIPLTLNSKEYNVYLNKNELIVQLSDRSADGKKIVTYLPTEVKGGFVENKDANTLDHCVTKNNFDGIRIARNQVSLDVDSARLDISADGMPRVRKGSSFDVYVQLNCVKYIRMLQFSIRYNPQLIHLSSVTPITVDMQTYSFFSGYQTVINFADTAVINGLLMRTESGTIGRYTYATLSDQCEFGSGPVAKFRFDAIDEGIATITFDPELGDDNALVLDCFTGTETGVMKSLPATRVSANIEIIS